MNILIGLLIIAVGSFGQSSSYVPIKKVKSWSWESFWLVQGIFAWLVFPLLGAFLAVPTGHSLGELYSEGIPFMSVLYGVLWGVGGLTFGLSMRYLGVALGQSISLGTCAAFGTLLPALFAGTNLFRGEGLVLLAGVCITLAGIAVIGYAGSLKARNMSDEEKQKAIRDFAFTKGISVALLAGMMSACFSLGLEAGAEVQQTALALGASDLFALNPVILLVTLGGFAPMRRIACGRISRIVPAGSISRYRYRQESITCCFALWRVCFGILNSSGWVWEKVSSPVRRSCWLSRGAY